MSLASASIFKVASWSKMAAGAPAFQTWRKKKGKTGNLTIYLPIYGTLVELSRNNYIYILMARTSSYGYLSAKDAEKYNC